jgi:AAHS family 4-hydroxybenzoate transporter-like MFS transporter
MRTRYAVVRGDCQIAVDGIENNNQAISWLNNGEDMTVSTSQLPESHTQYDVTKAIDEGSFTRLQKFTYLLAALAIIVDGFDGQMIGYALPLIMQEWGVTRAAFSVAVASGLAGMAIGSLSAGVLADKFGRKPVLVSSIFLFGAATSLIGLAVDVPTIALIRFFAGLGIGAALPAATTLTAEFIPLRHRTMAVTTAIVCYPAGGMLAGLVAAQMLPSQGWRVFFFFGGAIAMAYAAFLVVALRESPKHLVRQTARWEELRDLLAKMAHQVAHVREFTDGITEVAKRGSIAELFRHGRAADTSWLWISFFMIQLSIYTAFSWLPTMLTAEGLSPSLAGMGLTAYNFGGIFGAVLCAAAINRYGSRWPMIFWAAMSALTALGLKLVNITETPESFLWGLGVHGLFVTALQCAMFALCAHIYPTMIRTTGAASAMAFGRIGAFSSAFAGAAVISAGGSASYLNLLGGSMLVTTIGLAMVRGHIAAKDK